MELGLILGPNLEKPGKRQNLGVFQGFSRSNFAFLPFSRFSRFYQVFQVTWQPRAYCSACDHLIRKISSGKVQKSSSFEEFNGFSEIDVHFF